MHSKESKLIPFQSTRFRIKNVAVRFLFEVYDVGSFSDFGAQNVSQLPKPWGLASKFEENLCFSRM